MHRRTEPQLKGKAPEQVEALKVKHCLLGLLHLDCGKRTMPLVCRCQRLSSAMPAVSAEVRGRGDSTTNRRAAVNGDALAWAAHLAEAVSL